MLEKFKTSWALMMESLAVIRRDRVLLLFPILSGVFALGFLAALAVPLFLSGGLDKDTVRSVAGPAALAGMFLLYFALAFISTFFSTCTVYAVKATLEGGSPGLGECLSFAAGKLPQILAWAAISATVSVLLRQLESMAAKGGWFGRWVMGLVVGLFGLAWSLATIFVVQGMVYEDHSPINAIKDSVKVLKKAWGEDLAQAVTIGTASTLLALLGIAVGVVGAVLAYQVGVLAMLGVALLTIAYLMLLVLLDNTLRAVFHTVLYVYARDGKAPKGFDQELLKRSFVRNTA
ncbi:MAG TPA: DUF6159 family protein [bacterium]|jgi:hypothetical protein|nr:DUF6159 family protein [bacterium]